VDREWPLRWANQLPDRPVSPGRRADAGIGHIMITFPARCRIGGSGIEAARRVRLGRYPMLASNESLTRIY
jgi:hypothetical protein